MATELYANLATTTVSSGGTDAPAGGTSEMWTVASSAPFPAASTGVSQFHVVDPAAATELITVTNVSGTTWTVTRGAESTTPVTHAGGFTIWQVVTAGDLTALATLASPALSGTPTAPTASPLTGSTQVATTAYADNAVAVETSRAETAEALLAPKASPALTGTPTAPTKTALTNSTDIATTAYADAAVAVETSRAETAEALALPKTGGTMSGAIAMGSNKITGLANGSASSDTAAFGQVPVADTTASDIQPAKQSAVAGSNGKWADSGHAHPPGSGFLCTPQQYAPSSEQVMGTSSSTFGPVTGGASTVAAGSNGGEISQVATWSSPSAGVLAVTAGSAFNPLGGTVNVAASGPTTAVVTYTGVSGNTLTGCAYVSGSATGTVSTGGAVTMTSAVISTGAFTAPASGTVVITVSFVALMVTGATGVGVALAAHGTVTPIAGYSSQFTLANTTGHNPVMIQFIVPVTPASSYNFDLLFACGTGSDTFDILAMGQAITSTGTSAAPVTMTVQAV